MPKHFGKIWPFGRKKISAERANFGRNSPLSAEIKSSFQPKTSSFGRNMLFRPKISLSVSFGFRPKLLLSRSALSVSAETLSVDHYQIGICHDIKYVDNLNLVDCETCHLYQYLLPQPSEGQFGLVD